MAEYEGEGTIKSTQFSSRSQQDHEMGELGASRPKVLLIGRIEYALQEWEEIEEACEIIVGTS